MPTWIDAATFGLAWVALLIGSWQAARDIAALLDGGDA